MTGELPSTSTVRLGPVTLAPTRAATSIGWDSNVFRLPQDSDPAADVLSTTSLGLRSWVSLGRVHVMGRDTADLIYFRDFAAERSVDSAHDWRIELTGAHVTPYATAGLIRARERFGFEIDERARRNVNAGSAGVLAQLGPDTTVDVSARAGRTRFARAGGFEDTLLTLFDYASRGVNLSVRHAVTPFTTLAVSVDTHRDSFEGDRSRDSRTVEVASGVEFNPSSVISGQAYVGWLRYRLLDTGTRPVGALWSSVNLTYTLLEATRFTVEFQRDLEYSALQNQPAYLFAGLKTSVAHRLNDIWDVGGRVGRYHLSYGLFDDPSPAKASERAVVAEYMGSVGYRVGPSTRVAFELGRERRRSELGAARAYERTRAALVMQYDF